MVVVGNVVVLVAAVEDLVIVESTMLDGWLLVICMMGKTMLVNYLHSECK